jgi:DNA-binding protein HU-beta
MTKKELIDILAKKFDLPKTTTDDIVKKFFDTIGETLKSGEKVVIPGFGTFDVSERSARTGRNPQTGEPLEIKASKVPRFKPGKALKDAVN